MPSTASGPSEADTVHVLLASARDWFASALQAVLEPEGFSFAHVRSGEVAVRDAALVDPDAVIIDEGLPDLSAPALCRELLAGPLKSSVPILVYSPNFWHESEQAEAMKAGAWDILREPIRSRLIVAKLSRLLQIKRLIETTERETLSDAETGLFNLAGLMRTLPILGSLAERSGSPLSCAVLGPTRPATADGETLRRRTARLCLEHTRASDVCGWLGETDMALVVYGADVDAAAGIVRRLARQTGQGASEDAEGRAELSAGIVELPAAGLARERRGGEAAAARAGAGASAVADQIASLGRFAAAQNALRQARAAGGGIRVAETT